MPRTSMLGADRDYGAARRTHAVLIQTLTPPTGGSYPVDVWTTLATVFMSRVPLRADERFAANQDTAYVEMRWQMPYVPEMDPDIVDVPATKRLTYRGRDYDIQEAVLLDRRVGIELVTRAKVG